MTNEEISKAMRDAQYESGLTIVDIARNAGVARSTVHRAFKGDMLHVGESTQKILDVLGLELVLRPKVIADE